ncbi:hypothetical protein XNC1_3063 [Xenorhabdus nematophila ATCC 19061]|uniref:Uncharacterized protein n=1 Tax=Xenorhabdus nematophila (strain ATCC 19061 / DSM 3370 / CCUG 14189 / LMG 1036 / NCIMB 9965 / AN6) TaxID=406817 RepID=D3VKK9_XENNA|nr:hypothetical protein XNC1_3063 [Xenorhabdus nematophila ATCC 19061]
MVGEILGDIYPLMKAKIFFAIFLPLIIKPLVSYRVSDPTNYREKYLVTLMSIYLITLRQITGIILLLEWQKNKLTGGFICVTG